MRLYTVMRTQSQPGGWFRFGVNGPGVSVVPKSAPKLFSERHGFTRSITLFGWRFRWLRAR